MKVTQPLLKILLLFVALSNLAHAFYDPGQGRWISRDPIEEQGGLNVYAFTANKPINHYDRLGLETSETMEFMVVGTDVREEREEGNDAPAVNGEELSRSVANTIGLDHVDLYYGKPQQAALLITGFAIRSEEFPEYNNDISKNDTIITLKRRTNDTHKLRWGDYEGKKCNCVSDAMRINCLLASPAPKQPFCAQQGNNCQTDVQHAVDGCCLSGYNPVGYNYNIRNYLEGDELKKHDDLMRRLARPPIHSVIGGAGP